MCLRFLFTTKRLPQTACLLLSGILVALALIGCGQRGDLTLPQENPKPSEAEQQDAQ